MKHRVRLTEAAARRHPDIGRRIGTTMVREYETGNWQRVDFTSLSAVCWFPGEDLEFVPREEKEERPDGR